MEATDAQNPIMDSKLNKPTNEDQHNLQKKRIINLLDQESTGAKTSLLTLDQRFGQIPPDADKLYDTLANNELKELGNGIVQIMNLVVDRRLDTLFFLDKSGRPIGHLFLKVWQRVFPGIQPPEVKYINIGTAMGNVNEVKTMNDDPDETQRRGEEIRSNREAIQKELQDRYGSLRGLRIGVVDEYVDTGRSLLRARDVLNGVFPDIDYSTYTSVMRRCPSWYNKEELLGVHEPNYQEGVEQHFLVKPGARQYVKNSPAYDDKSRKFRDDLTRLAVDIAAHINRQPLGSFIVRPNLPNEPLLRDAGLLGDR